MYLIVKKILLSFLSIISNLFFFFWYLNSPRAVGDLETNYKNKTAPVLSCSWY